MTGLAVRMFVIAAIFFFLAVAIYRGKTNLIHDYHQTHVKEADKEAYGKSFSKGLFALAASTMLRIIALLETSTLAIIISTSVFLRCSQTCNFSGGHLARVATCWHISS